MDRKKFDRIRKQINSAAFSRKRKCFVSGCSNLAIDSHLLQRRGILNHVIKSGHLYQIVFLQYPESHYSIKKVGWKDALTFKGFCAEHDSKLFQTIEINDIDFTNYKSLLLLSYRPLLNEYRIKQGLLEALMDTLLHVEISKYVNSEVVQMTIAGETMCQWDVEFFLRSLQEDLENNTEQFVFYVRSIPKIQLCTSAIFSFTSLADSFLTDPPNLAKKEPLPNVLFNIIPTSTDCKIIFGYHKLSEKHVKPKIDAYLNLPLSQFLKELSDILIKYCDNWAFSETFYTTKVSSSRKELLQLMNYFINRKRFSSEELEFNLFK